MNTPNITNYKPKDFAEFSSCRSYDLRKYKKQIEGDEEIAKELQNGNKSDSRAENQD